MNPVRCKRSAFELVEKIAVSRIALKKHPSADRAAIGFAPFTAQVNSRPFKALRFSASSLGFLICLVFFGSSVYAQTPKTISLRMIDNKTGRVIETTDFLVQINHQTDLHADWVKTGPDGGGILTLPPDASVISVHAKYDLSMSVYVNCDTQQGRNITNGAPREDPWYPVATILSFGILAPDLCGHSKEVEKMHYTAKPGEFVFFVRKQNWREAAQ
jgi:hypothetical protein